MAFPPTSTARDSRPITANRDQWVAPAKPNLVSRRESYDARFWQEGICGDSRTGANIVTYNGEDIRGVMRIDDTNTRHRVIRAHNEVVRKMIAAEKR